jgi:DNA-binding transcriptional MerR regulator
MQRVLLDGGPYRLFIEDDTDYIEQDIEQLKVLFFAEGEGLPIQDINTLCAPLLELITVLQLATGILVQNFKEAKEEEKAAAKAGRAPSPKALVLDPDVLQRVLAHRADRTASKFLKKELRLPKKLGSASSLTGGNFGGGSASSAKSSGFSRFRRG